MKNFRVLHIELNTDLDEDDAIEELKMLFENNRFFEVSTLTTSTGIKDFPFWENKDN